MTTLIEMRLLITWPLNFNPFLTAAMVGDLDDMEYTYQDEYEARINFDVLDNLEPALRENIDLDFLAHLTNTDPALLEKYKVQQTINGEGDTASRSLGSTHMLHPLSSSQSSLKSISIVAAPLRRSSTVKANMAVSNPQPSAMKRVSTFTDINTLLTTSLNMSQTGLSRQTSLLPKSHMQTVHRGSHPNMEVCQKPEDITQHLLRLMAVAKLANQNADEDGPASSKL